MIPINVFFGNACEKADTIFEYAGFRLSVDSAFNTQNRCSMVKFTPDDVFDLDTIRERENTSIR